ncbi:ATP-dependent helicase/nuclease subunit A [Dissostichus eleginoides]|uniref:ATP-dependent helicase/nuclease subunit A n=1 Tax=Dissostichus eleginoides TaxID=100907 RepID=A0AAD9CKW4_DISEL|nr:ATP-dependent helicase/nuclease subunit A [Dissostichus eleginoides]
MSCRPGWRLAVLRRLESEGKIESRSTQRITVVLPLNAPEDFSAAVHDLERCDKLVIHMLLTSNYQDGFQDVRSQKCAFRVLSAFQIGLPEGELQLGVGDTRWVAYRQSHSLEETERRLGKRGRIGEGGGLNWDPVLTTVWPALHK